MSSPLSASPPRTRVARHGCGRVRRLPALRAVGRGSARVGAKGLVGVGLVTGVGAAVLGLTAEAPADAAADGVTPGLVSEDGAVAELDGRTWTTGTSGDSSLAALIATRGTDRAARSAGRTSPAREGAVVAPSWHAGAASQDYGRLGVQAVAKPAPTPRRTSSTSRSVSSTIGSDPGGYLAAGRALGLGPNAQRVYAAVRVAFPAITTIGGYRAGDPGDHGTGRAVDIMCSSAQGDAIAAYMQAHAAELHITYVIWKQRIWFPGTGTWRLMEDRGSATANHYDHVHVSVQ